MKKKILKVVSVVFLLIFVCGCGNTTNSQTMTAQEFKRNMEDRGLEVVDQTSSASDSTYQYIYVALDKEKYSFEYYFMDSPEAFDTVYQYAVSNINNIYEDVDTATITEEDKKKYTDYQVSAEDYYCEVIKQENTVLYVTAYHDYESEAKQIVSELGYK